MSDTDRVLWTDSARKRHWHVPVDVVIPPGDTWVENGWGERRRVDVDSLAPYAISEAEAEKLGGAARFRSAVMGIFGKLADTAAELGRKARDAADAERVGPLKQKAEEVARDGAEVVSELGDRVESVLRSPEVVGAVEQIGESLLKLAADLRKEPEAKKKAEEPADAEWKDAEETKRSL